MKKKDYKSNISKERMSRAFEYTCCKTFVNWTVTGFLFFPGTIKLKIKKKERGEGEKNNIKYGSNSCCWEKYSVPNVKHGMIFIISRYISFCYFYFLFFYFFLHR